MGCGTGAVALAVVLHASQPLAQNGTTKPTRLNQIIEQFEQDKPAFNGEHWQLIEDEHRAYDIAELQNILSKLKVPNERPRLTPVIRIPQGGAEVSHWMVKQALDMGVMGVIIPGVRTKEQVMNLVRYMRYPPQRGEKIREPIGTRGWGLIVQPQIWGVSNAEYGLRADLWPLNPRGELLALAMIESAEAIKNLDQIMSVPGLSGLLIGPSDMSMDMGVGKGPGLADPTAPEVEAATQAIAKKCVARHFLCGTYQSPDPKARIEQGFRLFPGQNPYRTNGAR
jgi:4-hydroxy-2-oxoheptanedioate aldolase